MEMVIGPILNRAGGYAFDTWSAHGEISHGYPYRRIEDAIYARKAAAQSSGSSARVCQTIDEFVDRFRVDQLLDAA